uniref:Activating transcription factor 7 interacting protein n=1 Tax=Neogobius melanostomus TaxID=47308 RepID=A0A8C6S8B2_9GOBI
MEVVLNEEKKKIFRARKTMKISDRQQLETLHSTLLTSSSGLPNSPQPLMNGTHKEDGQKLGDKEQCDSDSNSPSSTPAAASPAPALSLNLSPSPGSSQSPDTKEEQPVSPVSPFHSLNSQLKKLETNEEADSSSPTSNLDTATAKEAKTTQENSSEPVSESQAVQNEATEDQTEVDSVEDSEGLLPPLMQDDSSEPMETETDSSKQVDSAVGETKTDQQTDPKPPSPQSSSDVSNSSPPACSAADTDTEKEAKIEKMAKETNPLAEIKKKLLKEKMDIDLKTKIKSEKHEIKQSRPSSTPPSNTVKEESSSGLKRTLSDGFEPSGPGISRETKRPKIESEEFEAKLELKITGKTLDKIVQKLVEEKLRVLEMAVFDRTLQELKNRVDKVDCSTKHQAAINALQAKISRLSKKFGEANQASENKKKQEQALSAAAIAVAAATPNTTPAPMAPAAPAAPAAKTVSSSPQTQSRPARPSVEVKQMTTVAVASTSIPAPATTTPAISAPVPTTTALVSQTPILQLIASTSNAVSTFTASSTTSPTSTLVLKNAMMGTGQPLLIQLPLSMTNGQTGTLVNIPVSSLNAATSLNKAKTTAPTTFILKSAPTSSSVVPNTLTAATVPTLQGSAAQGPTSQISLARAVYQGGAGAITTPNAGVSVATVRAPTQSVSVAGALSSTSSPVTSVPAATGSTAPGPPQGTSLTTKTDNQATGSTPSKVAAPSARPKGSVIDLTEEDDDVLVTGVKIATVTPPSTTRTQTSIATGAARSSPQTNPSSTSGAQLLTQQRPLVDPKSRNTTSTPTRGSSVALPPLPSNPPPLRLPPEAEKTSPPQQPQLKLVPSQTGIVLSWCVAETDLTCAAVDSYHLYAFHQDNSSNPAQQHWKKIGEVKALPLPMACTLTQFQSGSTYHFAVRAKDIYGRFGAFCEPQCTNVISSASS